MVSFSLVGCTVLHYRKCFTWMKPLHRHWSKGQRRIVWMIKGEVVCRASWQCIFGIGNSRVQRMLAHAEKGFIHSPADLRRSRGSQDESWERKHADSYFIYCYHNPAIAETLAEDIVKDYESLDVAFPNLGVRCRDGGLASATP